MASISTKSMPDIVIVGGGAAGLSAAVSAAGNGAHVTLLERNEKLGKKIYITGKGRCNVTNACSAEDFRRNVIRNPRFLFSALSALSPDGLMDRLESWGCPTKTERGDRVFPQSDKASDVTRAFEQEMKRTGVTVRLNARVKALQTKDGAVSGVTLEDGTTLPADAVILCTGGHSYPTTGSTGDGYALLEACGHNVLPTKPSLIPLTCNERWVTDLQGLSLKNVRLTLKQGKKTLFTDIGEMLFTHFGISGPLVLSASSYMAGLEPGDTELSLDLKPGLTEQQLNDRILRDLGAAGRKQLLTLLCGLYPARLAETMAMLCQLDARKPACELRREERDALVHTTKALRLPVTGTRPISEAVITCGGADVRQINPATMESKLVHGLFVAGELMDVDALTGGFNLQIAFSTGWLAGKSASSFHLE